MMHLTMGHGVSGCFGTSLAPMRSLKRDPQYRIRFRCLLRWARSLHPFRMIIWLLVKWLQSNQHLLLRLKRLSPKWPLVAVIAAVFTIVMASMCIEPAAVSMHRTRCQRNGRERKQDRKGDLSYHGVLLGFNRCFSLRRRDAATVGPS